MYVPELTNSILSDSEMSVTFDKSLGLDMSDYDSVIGNIYVGNQYVYPHKDTTESKSARNYPVIVYTIGNNAGLGIVDNNQGKMTFANQYDKQWLPEKDKFKGYTNELKTKNGSIYTFGLDGKGRFELTHSTPMNNKKMKDFPPITLPNGKVVTKYTITLTFRRAQDLTSNVPNSPKKLQFEKGPTVDKAQSNELFDPSLPKVNIYAGTGENKELSNLANRPFTLQGVEYDNVEQYFQLQKFQTAGVLEFDYDSKNAQQISDKINEIADRIAKTKSGFEAKKLGGIRIAGTTLNEEFWNKINSSEMKKAIKASFEQNPKALEKLLATGNAEFTHIQESVKSKWRTEFPKLLMEVRQELRSDVNTKAQNNLDINNKCK